MNKIKQNLAGFAAVVVAATALTAVAPANAVGTTTTAGQIGWSYSTRGTSTTTNNVVTVTATAAANQTNRSSYVSVSLADMANPVTLASGDSIRVTADMYNVTTSAALTSTYMSMVGLSGSGSWSQSDYASNAGTNGTAVKNVALVTGTGNFAPGSKNQVDVYANASWSTSGFATGNVLRVTWTFELVHNGTATALPIRSASQASIDATSTAADSSLAVTSDMSNITYQIDQACVWRGENGVTAGTVIDVTFGQSGNAGTLITSSAQTYAQGSYTPNNASVTNNSFSFTMPAGTSYDFTKFSGRTTISGAINGSTFTPTVTAVIHGTSTNVLDSCARTTTSQTAPTITANGTSVTLNWTAPAAQSAYATTWDNVTVYACRSTLVTCGQYMSMGSYQPNLPYVSGFEFRNSGVLAANATTITISSMNWQGMSAPVAWSASTEYKYFVTYSHMNSPYTAVSATTALTSASGQQQVQQQVVTPTVPTTIPVVAPIKLPVMGVTPGAGLTLSGANMAVVKSIKIDSTAATTKTTVAGVEISVPADLKPGAHDLLITTDTGSTLFVGAIKVADPVVVAAKAAQAKAAASIAFRAPVDLTVGKSVTGSQAAQVKALAAQYKTAKSAICVAVPASKATAASALAAATKVCATIKAAIPGIATMVTLDAPSGDKVNRVTSEIQG